jgi:predicted  nucleic acid-binding Zn-ribbon protein
MSDLPDLHTPLPDRAHEMLRQRVAAAIDDLAEQIERINDAFLLLSVTADFSQATLSTAQAGRKSIADVQATGGGLAKQVAAINTRLDADRTRDVTAQADIDAMQDQLAALTARVEALESPLAPEV